MSTPKKKPAVKTLESFVEQAVSNFVKDHDMAYEITLDLLESEQFTKYLEGKVKKALKEKNLVK
jgi:single-stranded DNA-specific DHH superfamily exonuclease